MSKIIKKEGNEMPKLEELVLDKNRSLQSKFESILLILGAYDEAIQKELFVERAYLVLKGETFEFTTYALGTSNFNVSLDCLGQHLIKEFCERELQPNHIVVFRKPITEDSTKEMVEDGAKSCCFRATQIPKELLDK